MLKISNLFYYWFIELVFDQQYNIKITIVLNLKLYNIII